MLRSKFSNIRGKIAVRGHGMASKKIADKEETTPKIDPIQL
jgi:hypothetical protein